MRTYECVLVLDPGLDPERITEQLEKINDQILHQDGLIRKWDRWGKKRLAYEIQHKQYGYYAAVVFDIEPSVGKILDRYLRLNQFVLRHLSVLLERSQIPPIDPNAGLRTEAEMIEPEKPKYYENELKSALSAAEKTEETETNLDEQIETPSEEEDVGKDAADETAGEVT